MCMGVNACFANGKTVKAVHVTPRVANAPRPTLSATWRPDSKPSLNTNAMPGTARGSFTASSWITRCGDWRPSFCSSCEMSRACCQQWFSTPLRCQQQLTWRLQRLVRGAFRSSHPCRYQASSCTHCRSLTAASLPGPSWRYGRRWSLRRSSTWTWTCSSWETSITWRPFLATHSLPRSATSRLVTSRRRPQASMWASWSLGHR